MDVPLTPLDFMRRARRLYGGREAVVDGSHRWTYGEFFERCDQWSASLQQIGVRQGERPDTPSARETARAALEPHIAGDLPTERVRSSFGPR
jgi:acyl-CoA synthetase (AMP-forming)/AMP-acid ligase II